MIALAPFHSFWGEPTQNKFSLQIFFRYALCAMLFLRIPELFHRIGAQFL